MFSQGTRDTAERARSAGTDHHGVNLAVHLFDDLARGRKFMKTRVRIILKLLWDETAVNRACELVTAIDRALHSHFVRHVFELAAESFDQPHLLFGKATRDAEDNTVATRNSHECEPNARVSSCRLDDSGAGLE